MAMSKLTEKTKNAIKKILAEAFFIGVDEGKYSDRTCYFKVEYDPVGKIHFINFGQPDFILVGRAFTPFVPTKKENPTPT